MTHGRSALGGPCGAAMIASWIDLNWPSPLGATVASAARDVTAPIMAARLQRQDSAVALIMSRVPFFTYLARRVCGGMRSLSYFRNWLAPTRRHVIAQRNALGNSEEHPSPERAE